MRIITRFISTQFLELKVDEIETSIFKDSEQEIQEHIDNLVEVIEDLYRLKNVDAEVKINY